MKTMFCSVMVCLTVVACSAGNSQHVPPTINASEFAGFDINNSRDIGSVKLSGYEFKSVDGKTIRFSTCPDAERVPESGIAEYELFRYRLLLNSCRALEKYLLAKASTEAFFSPQFDANLVGEFPATSAPLLSKAQEEARIGKTVSTYFANGQISLEQGGSVRVATEDDEIIFTLLARGDFNDDGIEDLLIRSEWYARKANGKHVDLLVLTKGGKDKPVAIAWRLMGT
jgi:hypothetical protein